MTDDEVKAALAGLYAALQATNTALAATVRVQEEHAARLGELEQWEGRNEHRIMLLEAAQYVNEAAFLPPPGKLN